MSAFLADFLLPIRHEKYRTGFSKFVPWLRQLVVGLSPRRPWFYPRPDHMGFVSAKGELRQAFLRVLRFPLLVSFHPRKTWGDCVVDAARRKGKTFVELKTLARDRNAFRKWTEDLTLQGNRDRSRSRSIIPPLLHAHISCVYYRCYTIIDTERNVTHKFTTIFLFSLICLYRSFWV